MLREFHKEKKKKNSGCTRLEKNNGGDKGEERRQPAGVVAGAPWSRALPRSNQKKKKKKKKKKKAGKGSSLLKFSQGCLEPRGEVVSPLMTMRFRRRETTRDSWEEVGVQETVNLENPSVCSTNGSLECRNELLDFLLMGGASTRGGGGGGGIICGKILRYRF